MTDRKTLLWSLPSISAAVAAPSASASPAHHVVNTSVATQENVAQRCVINILSGAYFTNNSSKNFVEMGSEFGTSDIVFQIVGEKSQLNTETKFFLSAPAASFNSGSLETAATLGNPQAGTVVKTDASGRATIKKAQWLGKKGFSKDTGTWSTTVQLLDGVCKDQKIPLNITIV